MSTEPPLKKHKAQPAAASPPTLKLSEEVLETIPELSSAPFPAALLTPWSSLRAPLDAPPPIQKKTNRCSRQNLSYSIAARCLFY